MNYTFTYDDKNRLVKLSVDIDGKTQELSIKYENQKISFDLPGEELEATGNIACTYTLNTAGLATDLQVKIGKASLRNVTLTTMPASSFPYADMKEEK